ncbi:MAG: hypothetical protein ACK57K_14625 [Chryseotalea sp.]|jgi:hypothetical protein|nr:hypothetical protein [Flammeovirgaceae bacterium]
MKKQFLFFCTLWFIQVYAYAQLAQPARFEKEDKNNDEPFTVINQKENGLALYRETNDYESGERKHQLILLDTLLKQTIDTTFFIDKTYNHAGHDFDSNNIFLLFQQSDYSNSKLILWQFETKKQQITQYDIKIELNLKLTHFGVIGFHVILGGYINREPTIMLCDLKNKVNQVLPGFAIKNTELLDVRENQNYTFNVLLKERLGTNTNALYLKTYDSTGTILLNERFPVPEGKNILSAITSELIKEDLIIAGTWSRKGSNKAYGVYSCIVAPGEEKQPDFWQFGELTNFFGFLSEKRGERIKQKTKEGISNGNPYDYACGLMPYRIIENEKGFILLAESYSDIRYTNMDPMNMNNPYYQNMANPYYYNPYFNSYPTSRLYRPYLFGNNVSNTQEIKPFSSSMIFFNNDGKIYSDYSTKVEEIRIPSLRQVTDGLLTNDSVSFLYKKENNLIEKKISLKDNSVQLHEKKITLLDKFDEHRYESDSESGIGAWYNRYYYVWGYQTIRNKVTPQKEKVREVFYINKVLTP